MHFHLLSHRGGTPLDDVFIFAIKESKFVVKALRDWVDCASLDFLVGVEGTLELAGQAEDEKQLRGEKEEGVLQVHYTLIERGDWYAEVKQVDVRVNGQELNYY